MKRLFVLTLIVTFSFITQAFAIVLPPTDDAFVIQRNPTATTGALEYLNVGWVVVSGQVDTFLKFDLSGFSNIDSATLFLYDYLSAGPTTINTYLASNSWNEANLTYTNQPVVSGSPVISTMLGVGWKSLDVTSLAGTAAGSQFSLAMIPTTTSYFQYFYSDENVANPTLRPFLNVTASAPVPEPGSMALLIIGLSGLAVSKLRLSRV